MGEHKLPYLLTYLFFYLFRLNILVVKKLLEDSNLESSTRVTQVTRHSPKGKIVSEVISDMSCKCCV